MARFSVILAAAGKSRRFNDPRHKKPYIELNQKSVWLHSAERFYNRDDVGQLILVIAPDDEEMVRDHFASSLDSMNIEIAIGGVERADSVQNALDLVSVECDFVAIHDAARPLVFEEDIERVFAETADCGAAILATPVTSTVKKSLDGTKILETVDRNELWLGQTPQCFSRELIQAAYRDRGDFQPTDEAQLVERMGSTVAIVEGSPLNVKLTTQADLTVAESVLRSLAAPRMDPRPDCGDSQLR